METIVYTILYSITYIGLMRPMVQKRLMMITYIILYYMELQTNIIFPYYYYNY